MADDQERSTDFDPATALADVDSASSSMVESTDAPRGFMVVFVALLATVFALINTVPWSVILGLGALSVPMFLWYYLTARKQPKARPVLKRSGAYMGYFLLFYVLMHLSGYWVPGSWEGIAAKWLVVFAVAWMTLSLLRKAELRNRLKDANERYV